MTEEKLSKLERLKQQIKEILRTNNESLRSVPINKKGERLMHYAEAICKIDLLIRED